MVLCVLAALLVALLGFVPASILPSWLHAFTAYQPLTEIIDAARSLVTDGSVHVSGALCVSLAWCVGLLFVLAVLTVRKSRRVDGAHWRPIVSQTSPRRVSPAPLHRGMSLEHESVVAVDTDGAAPEISLP